MKVSLKIHSRFKTKVSKRARKALAKTMELGADVAIEVITRIVEGKLQHSSELYTKELPGAISSDGESLQIKLTGIAKDLDSGFPTFDLKPKLLASPSAKTSKSGGKYIDVPFKHSMSESGRYQGMPSDIKAQVKQAIKTEEAKAEREDRPIKNPLRVTGSMPGETVKQSRIQPSGKTKAVSVAHQTSLYSDMMRIKAGARNTFATIRRVSENSDKSAWWHPGFQGVRALAQAKPEIVKRLQTIFNNLLK